MIFGCSQLGSLRGVNSSETFSELVTEVLHHTSGERLLAEPDDYVHQRRVDHRHYAHHGRFLGWEGLRSVSVYAKDRDVDEHEAQDLLQETHEVLVLEVVKHPVVHVLVLQDVVRYSQELRCELVLLLEELYQVLVAQSLHVCVAFLHWAQKTTYAGRRAAETCR